MVKGLGENMTERIDVEELVRSKNYDAMKWAKGFIQTIKEIDMIELDEGLMVGWFSNIIMNAYDAGHMVGYDVGHKIGFSDGYDRCKKVAAVFSHPDPMEREYK